MITSMFYTLFLLKFVTHSPCKLIFNCRGNIEFILLKWLDNLMNNKRISLLFLKAGSYSTFCTFYVYPKLLKNYGRLCGNHKTCWILLVMFLPYHIRKWPKISPLKISTPKANQCHKMLLFVLELTFFLEIIALCSKETPKHLS